MASHARQCHDDRAEAEDASAYRMAILHLWRSLTDQEKRETIVSIFEWEESLNGMEGMSTALQLRAPGESYYLGVNTRAMAAERILEMKGDEVTDA